MSFLQTVKRPVSALFYSLLSRTPASWERKLSMLLDFWATDSRRFRKLSPMSLDFVAPPNLERVFWNDEDGTLDAASMSALRRFVAQTHFFATSSHLYAPVPRYAFPWAGLCTQEEFDEAEANEAELEQLKKHYHLNSAEVSSLVHHHGLKQLPRNVLASLRDTVFIDAGAFEGDSTLAFLQYQPKTVWAFEPSPLNQSLFRNTMRVNGIQDSAFRLFQCGLSDKKGIVRFSDRASGDCTLTGKGRCKAELVPLDSLTPPARIGLIKADLEGMGMSMLRGAVETIRRDMPVLSLSIYHNADEFMNTYAFVRNLALPYVYRILSLCPPWENHDLTLLAWANTPAL